MGGSGASSINWLGTANRLTGYLAERRSFRCIVRGEKPTSLKCPFRGTVSHRSMGSPSARWQYLLK